MINRHLVSHSSGSQLLATCALCGKEITSLEALMKIPVIDPYESEHAGELVGFVGKSVHHSCWKISHLWKEVARLAVSGIRYEFYCGEELAIGEFFGFWVKHPLGSVDGVGALFLPRSSSLYENLFGTDSRGGVISAGYEEAIILFNFLKTMNLSNDQPLVDSAHSFGNIVISVTPTLDGRFLLSESRAGEAVIRAYIDPDDVRLIKQS